MSKIWDLSFFPIFSAGLNLLSARLSLKRFVETSNASMYILFSSEKFFALFWFSFFFKRIYRRDRRKSFVVYVTAKKNLVTCDFLIYRDADWVQKIQS